MVSFVSRSLGNVCHTRTSSTAHLLGKRRDPPGALQMPPARRPPTAHHRLDSSRSPARDGSHRIDTFSVDNRGPYGRANHTCSSDFYTSWRCHDDSYLAQNGCHTHASRAFGIGLRGGAGEMGDTCTVHVLGTDNHLFGAFAGRNVHMASTPLAVSVISHQDRTRYASR